MWDEVKKRISGLQGEEDYDILAEELLDILRDTPLSESAKYDIEMSLYNIMDDAKSSNGFLRKAATVIKKKLDQHEVLMFKQSRLYYEDDEYLGDQEDIDFE